MPNRILKESIRESDSIDSLSWFEEVLFYRLIVSCDDYGRFDGRISVIKNRLFPLKEDLTLKTVKGAIDKLVSAGLVVLYDFEDKPFLYLPTWTAHQNVRAKRSKYPDPADSGSRIKTSASKCIQMQSEESNGAHLQENVPVIQSNTKSESLSVSESVSESFSGGGDSAREATESELKSIGLKPGEYPLVTQDAVKRATLWAAQMFRKYRPEDKPAPLDRRIVYILTGHMENSELLDYAFEKAQQAGKVKDWRYIVGIMKTLAARGIYTAKQAREYDRQREDGEE